MKKFFLSLLILTATNTTTSLYSQTFEKSSEIGLLGGLSLYSGDISPTELGLYFNELNPAFGIFGRFNLNRFVSIRAGLTQAKVSGDDINSPYPARMLNFRTNITELALTGEFSPVQFGKYRASVVFTPYLFGGAAVYHFNPQTLYDNNWIDLQPLGTEGQGLAGYEEPYKLTQIAIPFGAGLKFTFHDSWSFGLEFGARKLFNDHLDDISSAEVNYLDVLTGNGTLAATLSNPSVKEPQDLTYTRGGAYQDLYFVGGATLSFRLKGTKNRSGRGLGCPNF